MFINKTKGDPDMEDKKEEQKTEDVMNKKVTDGADDPSSAKEDNKNLKSEAAGKEQLKDAEDPKETGKETEKAEADGKKAEDGSDKSGFFKKKKDKKDEKIEELNDRCLRQLAEFDNYRKRTEKEKSAMFEVGAKSVIEKILPVVDNFERGLATADKDDPFVQGMQKTYKQLVTALESLDVRPIEAKGKEFNPDLHNAVMHVEDESLGENIVAEELQKGYTYRGQVVRHSMVKVAN